MLLNLNLNCLLDINDPSAIELCCNSNDMPYILHVSVDYKIYIFFFIPYYNLIFLPCVGTFVFIIFCRTPFPVPSVAVILLLFIFVGAVDIFAVDLVNNLDVFNNPLFVRIGRCVVVIFVNVYGGKSFNIRESIILAICWKLVAFDILLKSKQHSRN